MKRSTNAPADLVIRRYGVTGLSDWDDDVTDELRRANALWNKLVEIHRHAQTEYDAALAEDAGVVAAGERVAALSMQLDQLRAERKAQRRASRSRSFAPEIRVEMDRLYALLRTAKGAHKSAKAAAKAGRVPVLQRIEAERRAASEEARRHSGIYWGTANAIAAKFETARSAILKKRAVNLPADLHFRAFRGEGLIHNQITGGGITLEQLRAGGRAVQIEGAGKRATLTMTAYSRQTGEPRIFRRYRKGKIETVTTRGPGEARRLSAEINLHRAVAPPDADTGNLRVKDVELVVRRNRFATRLTPAHDRWSVRDSRAIITMAAPAGTTQIDHPADEIIAINLGWRLTDDGLRIAAIVGTDRRKETEFVYLPRALLDLADRQEELRSARDRALDAIKIPLRGISWHLAPATLREEGQRLAGSPKISPMRLARFVVDWQLDAASWRSEDLARFKAWRQQETRLRSNEDRARQRFLGRRREHYRLTAKRLVKRARIILLDAVDYAAMARLPKDDDPALPPAARRLRFLAANGEFVMELRNQVRKFRDREIIEQPGPSTWTWCHIGKHPLEVPAELRAELRYYCGPCRTWLDIDENNASFRLARYLANGSEPPPMAGALAAD